MSFSAFDRGVPAEQIRKQRQHSPQKPAQEHQELLEKWRESEHRLDILRSIQPGNEQPEEERMRRWIETVMRRK